MNKRGSDKNGDRKSRRTRATPIEGKPPTLAIFYSILSQIVKFHSDRFRYSPLRVLLLIHTDCHVASAYCICQLAKSKRSVSTVAFYRIDPPELALTQSVLGQNGLHLFELLPLPSFQTSIRSACTFRIRGVPSCHPTCYHFSILFRRLPRCFKSGLKCFPKSLRVYNHLPSEHQALSVSLLPGASLMALGTVNATTSTGLGLQGEQLSATAVGYSYISLLRPDSSPLH